MKKYYVSYPRRFANEYSLVWADKENPLPDGWEYERISRTEAMSLAREERWRRKHDSSFAHYADAVITPWWISGYLQEIDAGVYDVRNHDTFDRICLLYERTPMILEP